MVVATVHWSKFQDEFLCYVVPRMKRTLLLFSVVVLGLTLAITPAFAQSEPALVHWGATEWNVWTGGGVGIGHSYPVGFYNIGVRWGKILSEQHGPGFLRGNFEYAPEIVPVFLVFDKGAHYGALLNPVVVKWNFTGGHKVVPFGEIDGGLLLTTTDVPPGDTSTINFETGLAGGVQIFRRPTRSITVSTHFLHISNASIGNHNPSYNITMQFRIGYQWWRTGR
jgi:lipid A 3-O-deacylase